MGRKLCLALGIALLISAALAETQPAVGDVVAYVFDGSYRNANYYKFGRGPQ